MNPRPHKAWSAPRLIGISLIAVLLLAASYLAWQYWLFRGGIFRTSSFDSSEWKALSGKVSDPGCSRGGMAHDIKTRILRVGQSQAEVKSILGEPHNATNDRYAYLLGMCSGLRIDYDTLDVLFGSDGRLMEVQILQH